MTYSSGGLIEASDFNGFTGGNLGANVSGQINTVWGGGNGNAGYGQTAVGNVSVGSNVAATNWASLINTLNSAYNHQVGSSSGITAPVAGNVITWTSTLTSALGSVYTSRVSAATTGTTTASTKTVSMVQPYGVSSTGVITFTCGFSSADQVRYFFNAGGSLRLYFSSYAPSGSGGVTDRGLSIVTLANTNFSSKTMQAINFTSRAGAGGTVVTDLTNLGYYGQTTSPTTVCRINSTSYYANDYVIFDANTSGTSGSYGDKGTVVTITFTAFSAAYGWPLSFNDNINLNLTMGLEVKYPETTFLANTWGSVTVT